MNIPLSLDLDLSNENGSASLFSDTFDDTTLFSVSINGNTVIEEIYPNDLLLLCKLLNALNSDKVLLARLEELAKDEQNDVPF